MRGPADKKRLLQEEVEALVVEAKRVGADITEVIEALESRWEELERSERGTARMIVETHGLTKAYRRLEAVHGREFTRRGGQRVCADRPERRR